MNSEVGERSKVENQKNGLVSNLRELPKQNLAILVKDCEGKEQANNVKGGSKCGAMETENTKAPKFKFELAQKDRLVVDHVGSDTTSEVEGPMAMTYEMDMGWVVKKLGPTSGHWKKRARAGQAKGKEKEASPIQKKRGVSIPLGELDQNVLESKRRKVEKNGGVDVNKENKKVCGRAVAVRQHHRAQ